MKSDMRPSRSQLGALRILAKNGGHFDAEFWHPRTKDALVLRGWARRGLAERLHITDAGRAVLAVADPSEAPS